MMKSPFWSLSLVVCAAFTVFGWASPVLAAEEGQGGPADRIERLERRLNELAQRQEQMMQRIGPALERQAQMAAPGRENLPPREGLPGRPGLGRQLPPGAGPAMPMGPLPEKAKCCQDIAGLLRLCFLVAIVFNILLAIWIYSDIRKRGEGSGIFIALALLAGIPAAIIYSLVRIGDKKTSPN